MVAHTTRHMTLGHRSMFYTSQEILSIAALILFNAALHLKLKFIEINIIIIISFVIIVLIIRNYSKVSTERIILRG